MKKPKSKMFRIRFSDKEQADLEARAATQGEKLTPYVRSLLFAKKPKKHNSPGKEKIEAKPAIQPEIVATKHKSIVTQKSDPGPDISYRRFAPVGSLLKK